ncbi:hypothetical protein SAMN05216214_102112 [Atopomonas hussainii]|uniref:DUF4350 domain-containing protein n=1 Tax=Atopomonas hussainii TaxID=1429083 RepID=A0A1H7GKW5_9GAMM|nr:DUF4350 domain-containing protein [Atopomonas hussainii]SEK38731.1 hypothetical protein SAMN05216214_102112 [Atopomonas hussainii]
MNRQQRIVLLSVILGACVLLWWASLQVRIVEVSKDDGPSGEALSNRYLAAELFLRDQGIAVFTPESPEKLFKQRDNLGKTWLYLAPRSSMSPRQAADLKAWTEHGGHLVVVAEQFWNKERQRSGDLLLDSLGIQLNFARDKDDEDADETNDSEEENSAEQDVEESANEALQEHEIKEKVAQILGKAERKDPFADLTQLYLENEQHPAYLDFQDWRVLTDSQNLAPAWASSEQGIHLLQLPLGDGLLTVLSDANLWQNDDIGYYDNAWLLWYLAQDSEVLLTQDAEWPSLLSLLYKHYPLALLLSALLCALLIWQHLLRAGPKRVLNLEQRRELREHLAASADFLRRQSGLRGLLRLLKNDVLQRANLHYPGLDQLPHAEQCRQLARLTQLSVSDIRAALEPPSGKRLPIRTFIQHTQRLQRLRNRL